MSKETCVGEYKMVAWVKAANQLGKCHFRKLGIQKQCLQIIAISQPHPFVGTRNTSSCYKPFLTAVFLSATACGPAWSAVSCCPGLRVYVANNLLPFSSVQCQVPGVRTPCTTWYGRESLPHGWEAVRTVTWHSRSCVRLGGFLCQSYVLLSCPWNHGFYGWS